MKKTIWISTPLCATAALFVALNATPAGAADTVESKVPDVELRNDGTLDDAPSVTAPPAAAVVDDAALPGDSETHGAAPARNVEITVDADGATTVTRELELNATGAAPSRSRTMTATFAADGGLLERSSTDVRSNADGVIVREKSGSMQIVDGAVVRVRSDVRRDDAGDVIRESERMDTVGRPSGELPGRVEKPARPEKVERPEKVQRAEKVERPEKVERAEKVERPEKVERAERVERPEKVERVERIERAERPEKVERTEKIERPERAGRG